MKLPSYCIAFDNENKQIIVHLVDNDIKRTEFYVLETEVVTRIGYTLNFKIYGFCIDEKLINKEKGELFSFYLHENDLNYLELLCKLNCLHDNYHLFTDYKISFSQLDLSGGAK